MSKYLVTGVAGFIGSSIAQALLDRGDAVAGIDNLSTGKRENATPLIAGGLDFHEADICDPAALARACSGVDVVFHEAAIPSVPKSVADPLASHRANIDGTLNVLIAARDAKVRRVIYAASSSAYGDTPTLPKREDMLPHPISPYAVQKLCGELYLQSFTAVYGLETVSLRYFNVFGPKQDPSSPYSGVLARFTTMMLAGDEPTIFGDGEQSRDFTYISDVVEGNLLAAAAPADKVSGAMFNLATGDRITLNDAVVALRKLTGYTGPVHYAPERTGDVKHSLADITRVQQALGFTPKVNFTDGLALTLRWYREQKSFASTVR